MDAERSRHPAIPALASPGRLMVIDPPDDLAHKVREVLGVTDEIA
jgi:hypothetical protein